MSYQAIFKTVLAPTFLVFLIIYQSLSLQIDLRASSHVQLLCAFMWIRSFQKDDHNDVDLTGQPAAFHNNAMNKIGYEVQQAGAM
jgi:hypothetical protein